MTRQIASRLSPPYIRIAVFVLVFAAALAWFALPGSEDSTTLAHPYTNPDNDFTSIHTFSQVAVTDDLICAITDHSDPNKTPQELFYLDKQIKCWGETWWAASSRPGGWGNYDRLRVGTSFNCAFRDSPADGPDDPNGPNDYMHCWGIDRTTEPRCWREHGSECRVSRNPDVYEPIKNYWDASMDHFHGCWILRDDDDTTKDRTIGCRSYDTTKPEPPGMKIPDAIKNYKFSYVITGTQLGRAVSDRTTIENSGDGNHSCALVLDSDTSTTGNQDEGAVKCWGSGAAGVSPPSTVLFKAISGGSEHNCGIVKDSDTGIVGSQDEDTVQCWGTRSDGKLDVPSNTTFKEVSSGSIFSCGIVKDGNTATSGTNEDEDTIECWGNNLFGQSDPAVGKYKSISASRALTTGEDALVYAARDTYKQHIGRSFACAITIDRDPNTAGNQDEGHLSCWGDLSNVNYTGQLLKNDPGYSGATRNIPTPTPIPTPHRDVFDSVSTGRHTTCALTDAGELKCVGRSVLGEGAPSDGTRVDSVSVGYGHACGLNHYGRHGKDPYNINTNLICWGDDYYGQSSPPDGTFTAVAAGGGSSCGVKIDGSIECWGLDQPNPGLIGGAPTTSDFVDVKIGYNGYREHACGLKTSGEVVCWGDSDAIGSSDSGETTVPSGYTFKSIAAGHGTSCGVIKTDSSGNQEEGEATCWGTSLEYPYYKDRNDPDLKDSTLRVPNSVKGYPHVWVTPTPGVPKFKGPMTTHGLATCGILDGDYKDYDWGNNTSPWAFRNDETPYCQGWLQAYGGEVVPPPRFFKNFDYFSSGPYENITTSGYTTCAIQSDGNIECAGDKSFGVSTPQPYTAVKPTPRPKDTYTCGIDSYSAASPIDGGGYPHNVAARLPTATSTPDPDWTSTPTPDPAWTATPTPTATATPGYYVSIPAAALEDDKIVGIRMTDDGAISFSDRLTGHRFSGNKYTVHVKDPENAPNCTDPSPELTITRSIDVCIPKPTGKTGRWFDWQLFEVNSGGSVTGSALQGFTDLGGRVCAEVDKLPITLAAASMSIPTPTPTPTPTATPVRHVHEGNDLVYEKDFDEDAQNELYVRVHAEEMPLKQGSLTIRVAHLYTNPVTCDSQPSGPDDLSAGNIFRVGDKCYKINLKRIDGGDIGAFTTPAEICIRAPAGQEDSEVLYRLGEEQGAVWTPLHVPDSSLIPSQYHTGYACGFAPELSWFYATSIQGEPETPTPTPTPIAVPKILHITPNASNIALSADDRVRLSVDVYGVQDIVDNSLADDVTFEWSVEPSGGGFREADRDADSDDKVNDREVLFTTPSQPGRYTVKAELDRFECGDDDGLDDGCIAEIEVTVRRAAATPSPEPTPANPAGEIPSMIVDDDGNQYEVFTPEEGGEFIGGDVSVSADPGAVPNGEIIGVRADTDGDASNVGQTHHRVTLGGSYYGIYAVDSSGQGLKGYLLDDPISVCIPVPSRFISNISQLAMVSERADGTFATLSSSIRLSTSGVLICGGLSELSARLAVGHLGSPFALPSPTPLPTPEEPDTGGTNLPTNAIILLLMLGAALGVMSMTLVTRR